MKTMKVDPLRPLAWLRCFYRIRGWHRLYIWILIILLWIVIFAWRDVVLRNDGPLYYFNLLGVYGGIPGIVACGVAVQALQGHRLLKEAATRK
jgi:hypothetical protein